MLPVLTGILLKLYDDFVDDNPVLTNEYVVASLRALQIGVVTLVLANDLWLCIGFALFNGACALSSWSEYSRPHVVSYWALGVLCLAMSWRHRPAIGSLDIAVLIGLLGIAVFEPIGFPEETSGLKGMARFLGAWVLLTGAIAFRRIGASARSLLWMFGGYALASSIAQMLRLCYPSACHVDQGVHEDVHASTRRPPGGVPDENLPEFPRGVNPEGTP